MLGGSNKNSLPPVFLDENVFQYPSNASNQLQLFGKVNYDHNSPAFRPNKRTREVDASFTQNKLPISLNHNFYHDDSDRPSTIPTPHHVSTGLKLSYDDEERNSSVTSASASMTLAPSVMSSIGDSITTELDQHKEEFERFFMIQEEKMLKGIRDIRQRHMSSFLAAIEKGVKHKLHEKEIEIENINRKNKELMERVKQVANEAQNWHYRAKYNESMVNLLQTNLQQALTRGNDNRFQEGFGDTDAEVSSNDYVGLTNNVGKSTCKACRANEVSVLVMPCRHLSLCKDCDSFTPVCPVCQTVKTVSVEVYLS
ncbi:putative transcription factor C2H2 family [Helianthus annuus]|uniref:Putative SBP (S-ribonuclease binding protein) family protein n=1 Tax=Helianthus annuus TaxID=4232 RepID=A0A251RM11_HELAN|nr:probable BOI-related E3 ubiquitin-protein ligase 3 [Helianthus annuus]XP_022020995.1 probable BOI-related E3 ubiquitin-protein ligase 3 [Helianthus annuus]KAF5754066.1 putative transcription factor C2H2 family [Helianthus annuus]KAJ0428034.1 putative transcription factor C2H2 family [Helianthus annuus]KAJ0811841.1 putative transcription factor C2H2 family [Helianthus annuus]